MLEEFSFKLIGRKTLSLLLCVCVCESERERERERERETLKLNMKTSSLERISNFSYIVFVITGTSDHLIAVCFCYKHWNAL